MSTHTATSLLSQRASYSQWAQEHVRWSDTDLVGHTNNLTFGAFAETGRCMFLKRYVTRDSTERAMLLPAQLTLNFLGEVFWPARIDIGTGVLSLGNSSCRLGQGMFEGERCIGTAETVIVLIDETSRRPQAIPESLRNWFQSFAIG